MPNQPNSNALPLNIRRLTRVCCWFIVLVITGGTTIASAAQSDKFNRAQLDELLDDFEWESERPGSWLEEIELLGIRAPDAISRILPFLENDDGEIRGQAAGAYLALGGSRQEVWGMTKDASGSTRLGAALALLRHGAPPEKLMPLLSDSFAKLRAELGVALIESGLEPTKVTWLLKDEDYEVRQQVGVALVEAGIDPAVVVPLLGDEIDDVRTDVAVALAERKTAFDDIKVLLADELWIVRSKVGVAVCEGFGAVPELTPLLHDDSPEVRRTIGVSLIEADCNEERVRFLLDDDSPKVREEVAFALLQRPSSNREPLLDVLADSELLDEDVCQSLGPKSRAYLIPKLIQAGSTDKLRNFLHLDASSTVWLTPLLRSPRMDVRRRAFELLLSRAPGPEEILADDLRESLRGAGPGRQISTLETVRKRELRTMVPDVIRLLTDKHQSVRSEAAFTIARLVPDNTECIGILLEAASRLKNTSLMYEEEIASNGPRVLAHESTLRTAMDEPRVQGRSWRGQRIETDSDYVDLCLALVRSGDEQSLPMVARWLQEPDATPLALNRLLRLLQNWKGNIAQASPAVVALLGHSEEAVRESAIDALAENHTAVEPGKLIPLLDDPNLMIARGAAQLLGSCTPVDRELIADACRRHIANDDLVIKAFAVRWLAEQKVGEPPLTALHELLLANNSEPATWTRRVAYDEAIKEATKLMNAQLAAALAEATKQDEEACQLTRKTLAAGANDDQLRALLEQTLLTATDSQCRARAAKQLQELGDKRSLPALTKALQDESDYGYMISNHMGGTAPIRRLVLRVIADIGPSVPMQPKLVKHLFDAQLRGYAATALGAIGPAAQNALPILKRLYNETKDRDLALAIARIETNEAEQVKFLRQALDPHRGRYHPLGPDAPIDEILETGQLARHLIPDLKFMVEQHELLHRNVRVEAAYALAILEPNNPKWQDYLVQQSESDEYYFDDATQRLQQLKTRRQVPQRDGVLKN